MEERPTLRGSAGGGWSIVAPHRARRPKPLPLSDGEHTDGCHFCVGNEQETEPEVFALRGHGSRPDSPGWRVRVVPNKYPALQVDAPDPPAAGGLHRARPARGVHEVIIETPDHHRRLGCFKEDELTTVLSVYRTRMEALRSKPGVRSVALFRNEGAAAGASQEHPHAQMLALPVVSVRLAHETVLANRHFRRRGCCLTCESLVREAAADAGRIVFQNADFVAITAFAPRFPYETWILPSAHAHDFGMASGQQLERMAAALKAVLGGLNALLGPFPFNLVVQTAPIHAHATIERAYHWRLEILPRLTTASGFELGTGIFIVAVTPEEAARRLRRALGRRSDHTVTESGPSMILPPRSALSG
jgi:UDPglucose--hexose-1-phosphate uridylyltransferase